MVWNVNTISHFTFSHNDPPAQPEVVEVSTPNDCVALQPRQVHPTVDSDHPVVAEHQGQGKNTHLETSYDRHTSHQHHVAGFVDDVAVDRGDERTNPRNTVRGTSW